MSDKISYILEVNDQYTSSLKDFLTHLDKITDKIKGVGTQEKKNQKARVSYTKDQKEEFRAFKTWMHEERIGQTKSLFLEKQIAKAKKETALASKDSAIANAINFRTASQVNVVNQRANAINEKAGVIFKKTHANNLKAAAQINVINQQANSYSNLGRVKDQQNINNALKADRMITARAYSAPSGAFTPAAFDPKAGKFVDSTLPQPSQPQQPSKRSSFFGNSGEVSFKNVAKGMGYYRAIDMAVSVPSKIHDVTIQMDGLRAGLAALIPTVKGMKGATAEGEVNYLRGVADKYGADFTTIAPSYLKLLGTGGASDAPLIKGLLENVSGYAGLLNLETPAFERTMLGFQDMLSKQVLNAQEVNLQMANLPGVKPMFHKAYKRYAEKKGAKGITDENASIYFTQAMATGKLPSVDILRELVQIINEMFGEDMIKKSFTLGREEKRLKNAFQELGDQIGLLTYDTQIGAVRGLAKMTSQVNESLSTITSSFSILDEAMKDSTMYKIVKGMAKGLKDVVVDGTGEAIKAPFKLAQAAGGLITGTITGDEEGRKEIKRELRNYYFGNTNAAIANNNLANDPQKIEITIKSDNNIQVKDVKSNRPSTVKAGQRWAY